MFKSLLEDVLKKLRHKAIEQKTNSPEIDHLAEYGFFVAECVPVWYVCILELLALVPGRDLKVVLRKAVENQEDPVYDQNRLLSDVVHADVLFGLVCNEVKLVMKRIGLDEGREVGTFSLLLSFPGARNHEELQGMHTDTSTLYDWGEDLCFSCVIAGPEGAFVDLYPKSFDGSEGCSDVPVRIEITTVPCVASHL